MDSKDTHDFTHVEQHEHSGKSDNDGYLAILTGKLLRWGVETRGIHPVPVEERTDAQYNRIFFLWFSANFNIFTFAVGAVGPTFNLSLRDSCLVILFFNSFTAAFPAYLCTWGPKLGLRQMVQGRYSFGYYGVIIPCILNLMTIVGYTSLNCIVGGQTLASAADGNLSWSVGIVVIAVASLLLSFCGYTVLSWFEKIAWIPVLLVFLIILGVSGTHLSIHDTPKPTSIPSIFSYGAIIGSTIVWSTVSSDFTSYFYPGVSSRRIFIYSYLGILLPTVALQCFGATSAISAQHIPSWSSRLSNGNIGGLLGAMLQPTGHFGKFLIIILSLGVIGNISMSFYSFCFNVQVFIPALSAVPRYIFSLVATAIVIPLGIVGSHRFYHTLSNFLGLIGYWSSAFVGIILTEHFIFRKANHTNYLIETWNSPTRLPTGLAALGAGMVAVGMSVVCMKQEWFVGPVARVTGDIGFEVALVTGGLVYMPLRMVEVRRWGV